MGERFIHLVRHGQYDREPERLTDLGRAQAELVAARLAGEAASVITSSTAPRARETAAALAKHFPSIKVTATDQLLECIPSGPRRRDLPSHLGDRPLSAWSRDFAHLERACNRLLRPTRGPDKVEIVVIHGNLIRAIACRALAAPIGLWWDLWVDHCSVTTIRVRKDRCFLTKLNDTGHLPPAMVTAQ